MMARLPERGPDCGSWQFDSFSALTVLDLAGCLDFTYNYYINSN